MYEEQKQIIKDKMRSVEKLREGCIVKLIASKQFANASLLKFIDTRSLSFANESRKSALAADLYSSRINDLDMQLAVLQHQLEEIESLERSNRKPKPTDFFYGIADVSIKEDLFRYGFLKGTKF